MTGGVVLDDKDAVTTKTVPNVVVCNKKPTADDYTATLFTDKSTPAVAVKAKFTGANFTCLSGASALVASAAAVLSLATMM